MGAVAGPLLDVEEAGGVGAASSSGTTIAMGSVVPGGTKSSMFPLRWGSGSTGIGSPSRETAQMTVAPQLLQRIFRRCSLMSFAPE